MLLRRGRGGPILAFRPLRRVPAATYARRMLPRMRSIVVGYYIGITLLLLGLAGAVLMVSGIARPAAEPIRVDAPLAERCPDGERKPGCFTFVVQNATDAPISIECLVVPAEGTTATFGDSGATTAATLPPGASTMLLTAVDTDGEGAVAAPTLECSTVDA